MRTTYHFLVALAATTIATATIAAEETKETYQDLEAVRTEKEFDASQRAFYYARVLENPTCRWSTWDAIRAGAQPRSDLAATLQERAWSSPIQYVPALYP